MTMRTMTKWWEIKAQQMDRFGALCICFPSSIQHFKDGDAFPLSMYLLYVDFTKRVHVRISGEANEQLSKPVKPSRSEPNGRKLN